MSSCEPSMAVSGARTSLVGLPAAPPATRRTRTWPQRTRAILLTYADVRDLFGLIDGHWSLFESYLPPRARWSGRVDELVELRNRNAHCRRPHPDDVGRVEQTLRDLEQGARDFYASYARTHFVSGKCRDPLAQAWIAGKHDVASRLLDHANRQYGVQFRLDFTVRPWAGTPAADDVSGSEGVLWHAQWLLGPSDVAPTRLWRDLERRQSTTDLLFHLLLESSSVIATFSALDPADEIADAIGHIFDTILTIGRPMRTSFDFDDIQRESDARRAEVASLPARVQMTTPLSMMDPYEPEAFSIFAASG